MSDYMDPWSDNPFKRDNVPTKILWDYERQMVVDSGMCSLFDTCWTYVHNGITVTGWWVLKDPWSEPHYLLESQVPEMVRLAVMVSE